MKVSIIIPSLNPDEKLLQVVEGMIKAGFKDIIIVNDGSDKEHMQPFERAAQYEECTVLNHEVNKGKGRALKTAFTFFMENRQGYLGAVTVDGDNQHTPKDVLKCARELEQYPDNLILGVRNFDEKQVPFRSRFGNKMTSLVFRFACGLKIQDTQTGLRVFPRQHIPMMLEVSGERFEYETNMLLELRKYRISFRQVPIETVYINENETTHFHPIRDSFKIYKIIFKYLFGSLASALIDLVAFGVINALLMPLGERLSMFFGTALARVISSLFNYTYNRKNVFGSTGSIKKTMIKYYLLCVVQMLVSYGLVYSVTSLLGAKSVFVVVIKAVIDTLLFLVSFRIQQAWVFSEE